MVGLMTDTKKLLNVNIAQATPLTSPAQMSETIKASEKALHNTIMSRQVVQNILDGRDDRLLFVVGPCSIHDPKAAMEYAQKLSELSKKVSDKIFIVMRMYFEKPRTTVGWKGLINDPTMDDSFEIEKGLSLARKLLIDINEMGLATGTEALDPITPQYLSELITWAAIGARTTESQTHREMSSGLSMPVGFKNGTDGSMQVAIHAMMSVSQPHHFLGINEEGQVCKFSTRGNPYAHVVLRGGGGQPNYDDASIQECMALLQKNDLRSKIMVDCSHANSNKDHNKQPEVFENVMQQVKAGNQNIMGVMIESFLKAGNQKLTSDLSKLEYGVSVTDKCVDWETTETMILKANSLLS